MTRFDFISEPDFRESLEADYQEMRSNIEAASWKSAQVIAGSIVEALLIDYLVAVPAPGRPSKNPLVMDLGDAIAICRSEKILTDRAADLCSVVRSYRNLIHPGRVVRLDEPAPNKESANIAFSLVELITGELAKARRKQVGLTAEQLVSKIERDEAALSIFKHLVMEASEPQRERLLLQLIPQAHAKLSLLEDWELADRLESAFDTTFGVVSDAVRRRVAQDFLRVLKEADGSYVNRFAKAFFRAPRLEHFPETQWPMVCGYMLGQLVDKVSSETLVLVDGICPFLAPEDARAWVDSLIRAVFYAATDSLKSGARRQLETANYKTSGSWDVAVSTRFREWKVHFEKQGTPEKAVVLAEIEDGMIPF